MHELLLPGTHLLRRLDGRLQAGLREATVLPGPVRQTAELLADPAALATLTRHGLSVTDDRPLRAGLPAASAADPWPRHTVAALARRVREDLPAALAGRRSRAVELHPFGHRMGAALADDLATLCDREGLAHSPPPRSARRAASRRDAVPVLVGVGEPRRELLDGWVRDGRPHLVVRLVEGCAVLGPLVEPGRTACLRCTDAHLADDDPSWPLLVEQYSRAVADDRPDGVPEPVDAALAALAVAWAARDLATYLEGGTATTWSSTVRIAADLGLVETRTWPVHPGCGCGWH